MADNKYTRFHSNYQRRSVHKRLDGSVITERDWVTIGGRQRLGRGQTAIYGDGNFLFTTSSIPNTKKRHKGSAEVEMFTLSDVQDSKPAVDNSSRLIKSKDMRDYAYYGSCQELVRVSIENIVLNFPGRVISTNDEVDADSIVGKTGALYRVSNPFNIDLHHDRVDDIEIAFNTNTMRYLVLSKDRYTINGANINSFTVKPVIIDCYRNDGRWYIFCEISINGTVIYGGRQGNQYAYFSSDNFKIEPKEEVFAEFFNTLNGFEATILNRTNKNGRIEYKAKLLTPVMGKLNYVFTDRFYTWPSREGYIDIDSPAYYGYVQSLISIASKFDEEWSDNLYSRMTHESIKRYDTTFARDYTEGDADDNIEGGERMEKIIRVMGRIFDDIKLTADGISRTSQAGYGEDGGGMDADTVDDKLELSGWDVVSVAEMFEDDSEVLKTKYTGATNDEWDSVRADEEFRRRLLLSARYLNSLKGTTHGIEALLALFGLRRGDDYDISEYHRELGIGPSEIFDYDNVSRIVNEVTPYCGYETDPEDEFPNVPLEVVSARLNGKERNIVIPFYRMDKQYADPNFYGQCSGGWGFGIGTNGKYSETLNYLNVVSTYADLLAKSSMDVNEGDIYYVVDLASYPAAAQVTSVSDMDGINHFFKCVNPSRSSYVDGWINVGKKGNKKDKELCLYLDSIVNSNIGNNPHTGFGRYDDGQDFFDTMKQPFKYAIERRLSGEMEDSAKELSYAISNHNISDKIVSNVQTGDTRKDDEVVYYNDKYLKFTIKNESIKEDTFKNFVAPYLMQMIPSTAIATFSFE